MTEPLLADLSEGVLKLTLNDPDTLNALTPVMTRRLSERLSDAAADPDIRVVVLTGAGRGFSSGGNVKAFGSADPGDPLARKWAETATWNAPEMRTDRLIRSAEAAVLLHTMPKPTVAMIRGPIAGAALSFGAACDFRIVSDTALFTTAFGRIGTSGDFGGSYFLTRLLGATRAKELYFFSDKLNAQQAREIGLADRVVPDNQLESEVAAFAARLAAQAPIALRNMKQNINAAIDGGMRSVIALEARNMVRTFQTEDASEGVAALREKRAPRFRGV